MAADSAERWERRRQISLQKTWTLARTLRERLARMMAVPLDPGSWTEADLVRLAKLAVDVETLAVREGLAMASDELEAFDPKAATMQELEAFIARHRAWRRLRRERDGTRE